MSRISKYLRQKCTLQRCLRDTKGEIVRNSYGEPQYDEELVIPCRREVRTQKVMTTDGSILTATSVYYLDPHDLVSVEDLVDGHVVLTVTEYTGSSGLLEGIQVTV